VALGHLTETAIDKLNKSAESLAERIESAGRSAGLPVLVTRFGSMMHVHLQELVPVHAEQVSADPGDTAALHLALLLEGVFAAPRGLVALSTVLSEDQLDAVAGGYERAFERISSS
jgi:glutamate-1-semialdehyde aminotransferase